MQSVKSKYPNFIIFGAGNYNSLGVIHALAVAGMPALVLCVGNPKNRKEGNVIGYSGCIDHLVQVDSAEEGISWIKEHMADFPDNTVIYPTSDSEEQALDRTRKELGLKFVFPNCGNTSPVSEWMDKNKQMSLAAECGLRVLKSQYSNSPDFDYSKVDYPCMVKPLNSTAGSKGDMRVCENDEELREALSTAQHTRDFIVQQYIHNEADLLFLGVALTGGNVVIPALVKKPGVSPTGEYTHAIITTEIDKHLPEIEQVREFVRRLNYTGPFSIEFGLERGLNYFFEINLRNDGTSHYPLQAGVNIPMLYYNDIHGIPQTLEWDKVEYDMIDETADLRRVLGRELSLSEWRKAFRRAGTYRYYHPVDKKLRPVIWRMFLSRTFAKLRRLLVK